MKNKKIFIHVLNKNQIILILLIIILISAGIINSFQSRLKKDIPQTMEVSNNNMDNNMLFEEIKLNRNIERSKEINLLKEMLNSSNDSQLRVTVEKKIDDIIFKEEKEKLCENVLKAKGINCIIFSSNDTVYATIDREISKKELIIIQDVLINNFKIELNQIHINSLKK